MISVDVLMLTLCTDISRVQDDEVGDGTTSVVVLAGELLREAEQLVLQKIHPMTIIAGDPLAWWPCASVLVLDLADECANEHPLCHCAELTMCWSGVAAMLHYAMPCTSIAQRNTTQHVRQQKLAGYITQGASCFVGQQRMGSMWWWC